MAIDLTQFHQAFFDESYEALDDMENALLSLEDGADNSELINTVFRGAHSMKGGSATFGFTDVAEFTHTMETLLDEMRDGRHAATSDTVNLLLESIDGVRETLRRIQNTTEPDRPRLNGLRDRLQKAIENGSSKSDSEATKPPSMKSGEISEAEFEDLLDSLHGKRGAPGSQSKPNSQEITDTEFETLLDELHGQGRAPGMSLLTDDAPGWRIQFRPHRTMMQTGNDPVRIFRELDAVGDLSVTLDVTALPEFAALDPEHLYFAWSLELRGDMGRDVIDDAFAWVESECNLEIAPLLDETVDKPESTTAEIMTGIVKTAASDRIATRDEVPQASPLIARTEKPTPEKTPHASGASEGASIRVAIDKVDALINMVGELVITQSMLSELGTNFDITQLPRMLDGLAQLERNTREIQENVMRIRMLPISFAFNRFPRLVRDLTQKLGKKVELRLTGEQTELDKTVMEKIGDPLLHLVRNAIDHGIEQPEIRKAAGKPEAGTLHLKACQHSGNIVIEISDDGAGLNVERIRNRACERGLVRPDETLTDEQIHDLIFAPGFSTAELVSDVSGRGVGMDVVRKNIISLGGYVDLRSEQGRGSTITIRLPLTLAILDGQTVRVGNEYYIVPLASIVESIQVNPTAVNLVAGHGEVIRLRDEFLPIIRLYWQFDIEPQTKDLREGILVVVEAEGKKVGLFVDELLGQQQVVIKSLEANFKKVSGISGATILGDGTVALILDIAGIAQMHKRNGGPPDVQSLLSRGLAASGSQSDIIAA